MSIRLFIAIDIADDIKKIINNSINQLKDEINNNLKWIQEENMHITLKFLGDMEEDSIQAIIKQMNFITEKIQQQSVKIGEIAAFPRLDYPQVIYIGLNEGVDQLIELHALLENELRNSGFKEDINPYIPHITIARTRRNTNITQLSIQLKRYMEITKNLSFLNIDILLKKISLMKSTLTKEGAVYEEIYSAMLKNN